MGFGRVFGPWKAAVLSGAVVAALLVSCESRSTSPRALPAPSPADRSDTGPRTTAEVRWANRINALCARRNEHLYHLDYRDWPDEELASFTTEAIEVWHDYEQQAAKLRPPPSYRYRARMLAGSDAAFRDGLSEIRKEARVGRDRAVDYAIATLQE